MSMLNADIEQARCLVCILLTRQPAKQLASLEWALSWSVLVLRPLVDPIGELDSDVPQST